MTVHRDEPHELVGALPEDEVDDLARGHDEYLAGSGRGALHR